jgi:hypothetical protein
VSFAASGHGCQETRMNAPKTSPARADENATTPPVDADEDSASASVGTSPGDDGAPVVFTPDDVGVRPPDQPPTENAPASEKAGLIFERS